MRHLFARILRRLRVFLNKQRDIDRLFKLYDDLLAGKFANRKQQRGRKRTESVPQHRSDDWADARRGATDWLRNFWEARKQKDRNERPDISHADTVARNIFYYKDKVPALNRLFEAARALSENKHRFEEEIFGADQCDLKTLRDFARKSKQEWQRLTAYLWQRDIDRVGYRVKGDGEGAFILVSPANKERGRYASEEESWAAGYESEAKDLLSAGFSEDAAVALLSVRAITHFTARTTTQPGGKHEAGACQDGLARAETGRRQRPV